MTDLTKTGAMRHVIAIRLSRGAEERGDAVHSPENALGPRRDAWDRGRDLLGHLGVLRGDIHKDVPERSVVVSGNRERQPLALVALDGEPMGLAEMPNEGIRASHQGWFPWGLAEDRRTHRLSSFRV